MGKPVNPDRPSDEVILKALEDHAHVKNHAARSLGVPESTYRRWVREIKHPPKPTKQLPKTKSEKLRYDQTIEELTTRLREYEKRYRHAIQGLNLQEKIIKTFKDLLPVMPKVKQPAPRKKKKSQTTENAVLLCSDIHYGEVVDLHEMSGFNAYNMDIANRRIKGMTNGVCSLVADHLLGYNLEQLNVFYLGDMICGTIHEELMRTKDGNEIQWVIDTAYILAGSIRDLLMVFPKVNIVGVVGNHGRLTKKPTYKEKWVNWDFMIYQMVSILLKEEIKAGTVKCTFPTSFWAETKIYDWHWLLLHGDNIRSWMNIPWYGIGRTAHNFAELLSKKETHFRYMALGHFHNLGMLDKMNGKIIINGSVKGGDEYSIGKLSTINDAAQYFCGVHPKRGITFQYGIDVQGVEDSVPQGYRTVNMPMECAGEISG